MIMKKRKWRGRETTSDDATNRRVKMVDNQGGSFRSIRKPHEEDRANKGIVNKKEIPP